MKPRLLLRRRQALCLGGGALAALAAPRILRAEAPAGTTAGQPIEIAMRGTSRGEQVWFDPIGTAVKSGTTLRFINRDPGNSHTSTAYHPRFLDRQRRIPDAAEPWDSDFLLPDQHFEISLTVPGVYDFYCQPHEHAGMVGRIVVGRPDADAGWQGPAPASADLPEAALAAFPQVEVILKQGQVKVEV